MTTQSEFPVGAAGLPAGFEDVFRTERPRIVRALTLVLGDESFATEAADEGFTRAYVHWRKVSAYDNPGGWVYRVGLNWALSGRRRRRRETLGDAPDSVALESGDESAPTLVTAVRRLPDDQRAVVVARYYLDWSESEIASALGVRPGTVKSRLHRALERLAVDPDVHDSRPHSRHDRQSPDLQNGHQEDEAS